MYNNTGFSPTDQFQGLLAFNDDIAYQVSSLSSTLNAGQTYYYVQSGFENSDSGAYTGTFAGPGVVTFGAVPSPVPGPLGFLGAGAALACSRKLRRRHKLGQKLSGTTTLN